MADSCDLFVIGAGSGGTRAARISAAHGAKVMVAEDDRIGGTCVVRGCVPKKLFVYASRFADEFKDAAGFGWTLPSPSFDWPTLRDNVEQEVTRLSGLYRMGIERAGATIFEQRAVVEGPNAVRLADGRVIQAKNILVATGGHPTVEPKIPGRELAISSNEIFRLTVLPKRLLVVGGGYIGLEFASVFVRLGVKVTLVHRGDNVLRGFDDDLRMRLTEGLEQAGIAMLCSRTLERIDEGQDSEGKAGVRRATLSDGSVVEADVVLIAVGRKPNTVGLGLEQAGVKLSPNGAVMVDVAQRTSVPSIFAVGDVTDRVNLTPVAVREGHAVADSLFGGKPWTVDHDTIPTAVFTTPEIGTVGLSELDARHQGADPVIYEASFRPMKATLSGSDERMYMKLVVARETERVLGVHILGHDAAEIAQSVAIAVKMGATKRDFDATMALHPSAAEELVTMRVPRP